jgi:hypothetical protein
MGSLSIKKFFAVAADVPMTSDVILGTIGLTSPIAANEKQKIEAWVPFSVGATGGVRSLVAVPAGGTVLTVTTVLFNTGAGTVVPSSASTVFTNAVANAGTHWLKIEATVQNGATAGNVDVQMAQNTTDVLTLTALNGGTMAVDIYTT